MTLLRLILEIMYLAPSVIGASDPIISLSQISARTANETTQDMSIFKRLIRRGSTREDEAPLDRTGNDRYDGKGLDSLPSHEFLPLRYEPSGDDATSKRRDSSSMDHRERTESFVDPNHPLGDLSHAEISPSFPLVYRYFGRNQALTHSYGSTPFLLLGPNADHWKVAGKELSSRGYNVMACERALSAEEASAASGESHLHHGLSRRDSALLVLNLLDALKWNRVVLVGCDRQTLVAIEAAMQLAPHRVVGVVLCGNLPLVEDLLSEEEHLGGASASSVDEYLKQHLRCPFTIVWDGAIPPLVEPSGSQTQSSSDDTSADFATSTRSLILGGGSAPHRRRPELFAWALTRFVEERVDQKDSRRRERRRPVPSEEKDDEEPDQLPNSKQWSPFRIGELFSPGSMVVGGRIIATALFYGIVMKTLIFQYENIRWGMLNVKEKIQFMISIPRRIVSALSGVFRGMAVIFPTRPTMFGFGRSENVEKEGRKGKDKSDGDSSDENEKETDSNVQKDEDGSEVEEKRSSGDDRGRKRRPVSFLDNIVV